MDKYTHTDVWRGCLKDIAARLRDKASWHRSFTNDNHAGGIAADALDETALSIEEAIAPKTKLNVQHGVECAKALHDNSCAGYLHAANDDSPYYVDNCMYCGRCHEAITL